MCLSGMILCPREHLDTFLVVATWGEEGVSGIKWVETRNVGRQRMASHSKELYGPNVNMAMVEKPWSIV